MQANSLYKNICVLLYNILKNSKLRSEMVMNLELRKKIINQVNNLLGLEEDFDASIDNEKLSLILAQVIVNELNTEEQIEKPDKSNLSVFEDEYKSLISYIDETYPELMFSVNLNLNEVINKNMLINLPEFIKTQKENLLKVEELKLQQEAKNNSNNSNATASVSNNTTNSTTNNNTNNFNQNSNNKNGAFFNNNGMPNNQFGMPQNPILDPRFYPYKTKPKMMPILKKIVFGLFLLVTLIATILNFYIAQKFGINLYHKTVNGQTYLSFKTTDTSYSLSLVTIPLVGTLNILIFIMLAVFLGISIFGKRNFKREKYHISYMVAILSLIFVVFSLYTFIMYAVPSLFEKYITGTYQKAKWDDTVSQLDSSVKKLLSSPLGLTAKYLSIAATVLIGIEIIVFIMIFIYNPRIDQQKIQRAQYEYQKQIEAKFKGEEYHIDQSLFDEDEDKKENNK